MICQDIPFGNSDWNSFPPFGGFGKTPKTYSVLINAEGWDRCEENDPWWDAFMAALPLTVCCSQGLFGCEYSGVALDFGNGKSIVVEFTVGGEFYIWNPGFETHEGNIFYNHGNGQISGELPNELDCEWEDLNPVAVGGSVRFEPGRELCDANICYIKSCTSMPSVECVNPLEHRGYAQFYVQNTKGLPVQGVKISYSYTGAMSGNGFAYTEEDGVAHCYTACPHNGENGEVEFCVTAIDTSGTDCTYDSDLNKCVCTTSEVLDCTDETDPPLPDPSTWSARPSTIYQSGYFYHKMIATAAIDQCCESGIMYCFECTTHPAYSSGWQSSSTWQVQVSGQSDTQSYRTKSRDCNGNETDWSETVQVDT
jgi:hypothetical protein